MVPARSLPPGKTPVCLFCKYENPASLLDQVPVQVAQVPGEQVAEALQPWTMHNQPVQDGVGDGGGRAEIKLEVPQSLKVRF